MAPASARTPATSWAVACIGLCLIVLVTAVSVCSAALCARMQHPAAHGTTEVHAIQPASKADMPVPASRPSGSPAHDSCCVADGRQPLAVLPTQRLLPDNHATVIQVETTAAGKAGQVPLGAFDPVSERRDQLTPSLFVLSISRT